MSYKMEIKNLRPFIRVLRRIHLMSTPIAKALGVFCGRVVSEAQITSPVRTGRLRSSWTYWATTKKWKIGTLLYYARFLEYGTRKMRARPTLHPAVRANLSFLQQQLTTEHQRYFDREFAGVPA